MRSDVEFVSDGDTVRGWSLTPEEGDTPRPTVVMAGGWRYVKELPGKSWAKVSPADLCERNTKTPFPGPLQ
jgi:uncharacterized protein